MTDEQYDAITKIYWEKFGNLPISVPCDLGRINLTLEQYAAYMQAAIDAGKPVNWYDIFPPLPEGCLS